MPAPTDQPHVDDIALHAAATDLANRLHQALTAAAVRGRSNRRYQTLSAAWQNSRATLRALAPLLPARRTSKLVAGPALK